MAEMNKAEREEMKKRYHLKDLDTELTAEDKEEVEELKAGGELIVYASNKLLGGFVDKGEIYDTVYSQLQDMQVLIERMAKRIKPLIEKYYEIWLSERGKQCDEPK